MIEKLRSSIDPTTLALIAYALAWSLAGAVVIGGIVSLRVEPRAPSPPWVHVETRNMIQSPEGGSCDR